MKTATGHRFLKVLIPATSSFPVRSPVAQTERCCRLTPHCEQPRSRTVSYDLSEHHHFVSVQYCTSCLNFSCILLFFHEALLMQDTFCITLSDNCSMTPSKKFAMNALCSAENISRTAHPLLRLTLLIDHVTFER
jgi:hypothetical protein